MSANSRYKTHRGREFNMSAFVEKNGDTKAVGNVPMNARGDIIDAKGNVKIPTQSISRATANIKNNESKQVSLKADENLSPVQNTAVAEDFKPTVVASREITTIDGMATEVEYSDGSIQVIPKTQTPTSL
jgi:hypothetical protein